MELYACGSNAWNQLNFSNKIEVAESRDLYSFQCVLCDGKIEVIRASFSATLVRTSSSIRLAGMADPITLEIQRQPDTHKLTAEAGNGSISRCVPSSMSQIVMESSRSPSCSWDLKSPVLQIVAGSTFFVALCADSSIWTWGDERYPACLARNVSSSSPAHQPEQAINPDLLPEGHFTKITTSPLSYTAAALTSTNDVYFWGMWPGPGASAFDALASDMRSLPPRLRSRPPSPELATSASHDDPNLNATFSPDLDNFISREPLPLDLCGLDVCDVAVGDMHMLVLTTDGRVWVRGEGMNGQLDLGREVEKTTRGWTRINLGLPEGKRAVGVAAGPHSSFVLVSVGH